MSAVIKVSNLSKQYRLGQVGTGTISHDVNRWWHKIRGKEDPYLKIGESNDRTVKGDSDYVWALKDINFEVQQGEVLGIIGRNGAGKSTLLKILSRTTSPTTGTVKLKGRVASLLEVGTGFHPELSGRDNIYLNGAILGMTRQEIKRKFDEIVDFAGVERYIDTPVKRYSSGMYVRLAFGVAAHLESEILIVDEVLSVGDIEFQKKCLGKMKEVSEGQGRTVLYVSHNLASMKSLCNEGIIMNNGEIKQSGGINFIINNYQSSFKKYSAGYWINKEDNKNEIYLESLSILNESQQMQTDFISSEAIFLDIRVVVKTASNHLKIGFDLLKNEEIVFRSQQVDTSEVTSLESGVYTFKCKIPKFTLNEGVYSVKPLFSIHCVRGLVSTNESVVNFNVLIDTSISDYHHILSESNHPGMIYPFLQWEIINTAK